jgi:hypothetical protein
MHENSQDGPVGLLPAAGPEYQRRAQSGYQVTEGLIALLRSIEKAPNDV